RLAFLLELRGDDLVRVLIGVLAQRGLGREVWRAVDQTGAVFFGNFPNFRAVGRHVDAVDFLDGTCCFERPGHQRLSQYIGDILARIAGRALPADKDSRDHEKAASRAGVNSRTMACARRSWPSSFMWTRSTKSQRSCRSAELMSTNPTSACSQ